jgi:enhancing lycopene biosynthesis protein 2
MRRIGILLAGCGRYDGSDIRETVLLATALEKAGYRTLYLAPDIPQNAVFDHATGEKDEGAPIRGVLEEAARLAGGAVRDATEVLPSELDGLVIPGGAGVVANLCEKGERMLGGGEPIPAVRRLLDAMAGRGAPVAGLGLARIPLLRHHEIPLDEAGEIPAAGEVAEEADGAFLYLSGTMGGDSLADLSTGIDRLVAALGRKIGTTKRKDA